MENNNNDSEKDDFLDINTETKDWTLEIILGVIESGNERSSDFPITLNVGGLVIMGILISEREFLEKVLYGAIYKKFKQGMQEINASENAEYKEDSIQNKVYRFIHLKDAKFYSSSEDVVFPEGLLWRGRLSSVDGYFLK